jgi:hypothetical protein
MAIWHVWAHAEWAGPPASSAIWAEHLAAALRHAGMNVRSARQHGRRFVIDGSLEADSLGDVAGVILGGVASTGLATILVAMEIADNAERDRQLAVPDLIGVAEIAVSLSVSKSRASRLARSRAFPLPVATLSSGPVWVRATVDKWALDWRRRSGRRRRPT